MQVPELTVRFSPQEGYATYAEVLWSNGWSLSVYRYEAGERLEVSQQMCRWEERQTPDPRVRMIARSLVTAAERAEASPCK